MAFRSVNHKQTREHEVGSGYIWSPYRNANGAFNQTYENMRHVRVGDVVFSYADGRIGAVGRVNAEASPSPKPVEFVATSATIGLTRLAGRGGLHARPKPLSPRSPSGPRGRFSQSSTHPSSRAAMAAKAAISPASRIRWGIC